MTTQQPEALRLAWLLELAPEDGVEPQTTEDAAAELRRLHAYCQELEAQVILDCMTHIQNPAPQPSPEALRAAPNASYSPEDRAFHQFWYSHMFEDLMQPPLIGIPHSTARYIWDAALRTAHVQKPTEIEHVADDVSKNGAELNMSAQQPAPATQQAGEVRPVTPYTCPKCHALWLHWPAEQTGFGRDTLNCRSADHCHYCEKAGVEQLQRLERIPAALHAPQPSPTAQAADSVPAVSDLPPLPAPDLRDVGTKPQEIKEFLKGYATEYARTAIAARAPADSVMEDAAQVEIDLFNDLNRIYGNTLTAYAKEMCRLGYRKTNAARKQGANK